MAEHHSAQSFICAIIPADGLSTPPTRRAYIEDSITEVAFPMQPSNPLALKYAALILRCENVTQTCKFYDRDSSITDWYYEAYVAQSEDTVIRRSNSITNILKYNKTDQARGDTLIMKNGPVNGSWETSPDVNIASLARTIWWYRGSGRDVSTVFGERGLIRILGDLPS